MLNFGSQIHAKTPQLSVIDNRGLWVRSISYCRHPGSLSVTEERITRQRFNPRGQLSHCIDPRVFELLQTDSTLDPNLSNWFSLTGTVLRTDSIDAGTRVTLNDSAGRPHLSVSATGVTRNWEYEDQNSPGRLLSISDQVASADARITERFVWAGNSTAEQSLNLAGQCIAHYDTAGLNGVNSVGLTGTPMSIFRQLLLEEHEANWQGDGAADWQKHLDTEVFTSHCTTDAGGVAVIQTDAKGNQQRLAFDIAGQLKASWLTLKDAAEQVIVSTLDYSAGGQKMSEVHGNGVLTTYTYEASTQRLVGIKTERPAGHPSGARLLQDLRYEYDPVGNVLKVRNEAEATRFWRNQKVSAQNIFVYDSAYQLVESKGREMANSRLQNSEHLPPLVPIPPDNSIYTLYTRTYSYDRGGNLIQVRHITPATDNSYTIDVTVSSRTNRAVLNALTQKPDEVDALFDAGGHQLQLQPGQQLTWTVRGELLQVGDETASSHEHYRYDSGGMRIRKVNVRHTDKAVQTLSVTYLPGLELRTICLGERVSEDLHTLLVGESGQAQVRVLHWETGRPAGISDNQVRYSYDNLIGSSGLELDANGEVLSYEEYYPFGGTAIWAATSLVEADYKTVRYSGKERDATGLYYYGYRYYQPWVCRWLSADPAGAIDGLNLFRMVRNNPVTLADAKGLAPSGKVKKAYFHMLTNGSQFRDSMPEIPRDIDEAIDIVARQSERNLERLANNFEKFEPDTLETDFFLHTSTADYEITHFSSSDFTDVEGNAHFLSRQQLEKRNISFNTNNTEIDDLVELATDRFAFFSIGEHGGKPKTKSRFGNFRYAASYESLNRYQDYALLQTHDLLLPLERPSSSTSSTAFLADSDRAVFDDGLLSNFNSDEGAAVIGSIYMGKDIKEGLAMTVTWDFHAMGVDTKQKILERVVEDSNSNSIVQAFYRPQLLIPNGMRLSKGQFTLTSIK